MKKYLIIQLLVISMFIIFAPKSHAQKKELVWLNAHFPPYTILSEPFKGMGNVDYMQKLVIKSLKNYKHISIVANSKRIFHELKIRDMAVYASALKTKEREKYLIYSVPYSLALPNVILIQKSKLNLFKPYINKGVFLLDKAIMNSELKLLVTVGRSYGGEIDEILLKNNGNKNIKVYFNNISRQYIGELFSENVDYIIGYSCEMAYYLKRSKKIRNVVSIPVKGMSRYLVGYFTFPKTKWGEEIVKITNSILKKHRDSKAFHASYEYWLDDSSIKLYRKYVKEFYKNQ